MGTIVAYARVSTGQQDYQTQVDRLTAAGATKVFAEKRSGLDGERPQLAECLRYVREGDALIVTKLDRLARSTADLYRIVTDLTNRGVAFRVLVARFSQIVGYRCLSLIRASIVVNRQSALAW